MSARWTPAQLDAHERAQTAARLDRKAKQNKYRNNPVTVDGIRFDSKAEATHYGRLKLARDAGHLTFERQVPYKFEVIYRIENGQQVTKKMEYRADFVVTWKDGRVEVQDVKGVRTKEYNLKKKLMLALYGIEIREISI